MNPHPKCCIFNKSTILHVTLTELTALPSKGKSTIAPLRQIIDARKMKYREQ